MQCDQNGAHTANPKAAFAGNRNNNNTSRFLDTTLAVQGYCIVAGGILAFALWNHGLRHWKTSEVYLFNNLIPLSTVLWAHLCLGEIISPTFWPAMALIVAGVLFSQANWRKLLGKNWLPAE